MKTKKHKKLSYNPFLHERNEDILSIEKINNVLQDLEKIKSNLTELKNTMEKSNDLFEVDKNFAIGYKISNIPENWERKSIKIGK